MGILGDIFAEGLADLGSDILGTSIQEKIKNKNQKYRNNLEKQNKIDIKNIVKDIDNATSNEPYVDENGNVSRRCKSCGAIISGKKGDKVICEYCDQLSVL